MLNVSALHRKTSARKTNSGFTSDKNSEFLLSRRKMLGLSGTAAFGATAVVRSLASTFNGYVDFTRSGDSVSFHVDGLERWRIEPRKFGGNPRLTLLEERKRILLTLREASFPGTTLPADLSCELRTDVRGWEMKLWLALTGTEIHTPFADWLVGRLKPGSEASRDLEAQMVSSESGIRLIKGDKLIFNPDWSLSSAGEQRIRLHHHDVGLESKAISLRLLDVNEASLMRNPMRKRTSITLSRENAVWKFQPHVTAPAGTTINTSGQTFDSIRVEVGETIQGNARGAVLYESLGQENAISYSLGHKFNQADDEPFTLSLTNPRYAITLPDRDEHSALVADFSEQLNTLNVRECSLKLSGAGDTPPFELVSRSGRVDKFICAPGLVDAMVPLPGASMVFSRPLKGMRVALASVSDIEATEGDELSLATVTEMPQQLEVVLPLSEKLVLRAEDLLILKLKFRNLQLRLSPGREPRIVAKDPTAEGVLTAVFQPQHFAEEKFTQDHLPAPNQQVRSRLSADSRLSFVLHEPRTDPVASSVPFRLEEILRAIRTKRLKLKGRGEGKPADDETAIEAPYRLILSPDTNARWVHESRPVTQSGELDCTTPPVGAVQRTELWHSRLASRTQTGEPSEADDLQRTLRAVWARDQEISGAGLDPFPMLPVSRDRTDLVKLTQIVPIKAQRLMLSALGAWMRVEFRAPRKLIPGVALELWRQHAMMGRDQYVKVVSRGYLYPWRHECSAIEIVERRFEDVGGRVEALLVTKCFLVVKSPRRISYDGIPQVPHAGRKMFPAVEVLDDQVIRIFPKSVVYPDQDVDCSLADYFWPDVKVSPIEYRHYPFKMEATDYAGNAIRFEAGAIFVRANIIDLNDVPPDVKNGYLDDQSLYARRIDLHNQEIVVAPLAGNTNTAVEASIVVFSAEHITLPSPQPGEFLPPQYFPAIELVEGRIPAVKQLRSVDTLSILRYEDTYLSEGFGGSNKGKVFMEVDPPLRLDFRGDTDKSGAFFRPRLNIVGLSALSGIVGGKATGNPADARASLRVFTRGTFNPEHFFEGLELFGTDDLRKYVAAIPVDTSPAERIPKLLYSRNQGSAGIKVQANLLWQTTLNPAPSNAPPVLDFQVTRDSVLGSTALPHSKFRCELERYVKRTDDVDIKYGKLRYINETGVPPVIETPISERAVTFKGDLRFVQGIAKILKTLFHAESHIYDGILTLSFGFRLPNIDFGIFRLHNLSVYTLISIGYFGTRFGVEFKIADPSSPCTLTVGPFYGKAHFVARWSIMPSAALATLLPVPAVLAVCPPSIDTGFEFGAHIGFDIGIAALSLGVSAGIRFQLNMQYFIELAGFFHCHGSMRVGPFSAGVGFDANLHLRDSEIVCSAELRIDIDLFLFSFHFGVRVEFRFSGSPFSSHLTPFRINDDKIVAGVNSAHHTQALPSLPPPIKPAPTFAEQISEHDWDAYCEAFA